MRIHSPCGITETLTFSYCLGPQAICRGLNLIIFVLVLMCLLCTSVQHRGMLLWI